MDDGKTFDPEPLPETPNASNPNGVEALGRFRVARRRVPPREATALSPSPKNPTGDSTKDDLYEDQYPPKDVT